MNLIIKKKKKNSKTIIPETKETNFQIDIKHLFLIAHSRVFSPLFNFPVNVVDHRSNTLAFLALLIKGCGFNIGWT